MGTLRAALAVTATAALITAGLLVGAPAGAVELVANPGFESGLAGWTCTAETGVGTQARTGVRALTGTPNATTAECAQTIPVTAGAAYTLTAWVNGAFVFLGASGTPAGEVSTWTPGTAGAYSQLTIHFTGGSAPVRIWVHGWYAQGTYSADDVSLQGPGTAPPPPTNPPTTPPPTTPTDSPHRRPARPAPGCCPGTRSPGTGTTSSTARRTCGCGTSRPRTTWSTSPSRRDRHTGRGQLHPRPAASTALGGYTDANLKADVADPARPREEGHLLRRRAERHDLGVRRDRREQLRRQRLLAHDPFGFDGVDIDLENGVNPTFMGQALHQMRAQAGSGLLLTMAPQTIDMQSTGGAYFQLALASRTSSPSSTCSTTTPARCSAATAGCTPRAPSTSSPRSPASSCRAGCGRPGRPRPAGRPRGRPAAATSRPTS